MVASKNRLEKLEKQTQQGTNKPTWKDLVTIANNPELRGGSLDSLAETLGVTRAELDEGLQVLRTEANHEQQKPT